MNNVVKLKPKVRDNFCAGFSLLEVLIASVIGMLLIGIVLQNYLGVKRVYRLQDNITQLSDNLRFADFFLRQNIMHAGFGGCRKISDLHLNNHAAAYIDEYDDIHGYDSTNLPYYLLNKDVIPETDVLVVSKANTAVTALTENVAVNATSVRIEKNPATIGNPFLLIADCKNADLLIAQNIEGKRVSFTDEISHSYQISNTTISRFERLAFFISKPTTKRVTANNQPVYSLYFAINNENKEELIPGISSMKITYGIDSGNQGKVDQYLPAAAVTEQKLWSKVLSVIIILKSQNQLSSLDQWKFYIKLRERG